MKRKIIIIDENKCNGCGQCASGCPEGAIKMINGKARLVNEFYCDGLGACIGTCPVGAISIEERTAAPYDEKKTMGNIVKEGPETINAHLDHLKSHNQTAYYNEAIAYLNEHAIPIPGAHNKDKKPSKQAHEPCACPGSAMRDLGNRRESTGCACSDTAPATDIPSALSQWPIQLHLINPQAPYFNDAHLLVAADCVAFALGSFHPELLAGKRLVIFCPKLDDSTDVYIEKLTELLSENEIHSITVAHMEVPCCFGTVQIVKQALGASGKKIPLTDITVAISGEIKSTK